jgi:single-stranded DNA-binding protein
MADDLTVSALNFFAGFGYLTGDAEFFMTRSQRPKVTFRFRIPRSANMPRKGRSRSDFYSVVALGERFVPLLDHLTQGVPVVVHGFVQSRDITVKGRPRTVSEIAANAVYLVCLPNEDGARPNGGEGDSDGD